MSKRIFFSVISIISLILGATIYMIYRENSYVTVFAEKIFSLTELRTVLRKNDCEFVKFYLTDYLWGLSLSCGLIAVFDCKFKAAVCSAFLAFLYGTVWEILQFFNLVSGTSDILDIFMYFIASGTPILFFYKKEKVK